MREERKGDNDPQTLPVTRACEERLVPDVGCDVLIERDGRLYFLELVLNKGVMPGSGISVDKMRLWKDILVSVCVVICERP